MTKIAGKGELKVLVAGVGKLHCICTQSTIHIYIYIYIYIYMYDIKFPSLR